MLASLGGSMQEFFTPAEVATLFNYSLSYIYKLVSTGILPALKVGRSIRIKAEDIGIFINKNYHGVGEQKREMAPTPSPQKNKVKNAGTIPLPTKRYLR
jgi:excisionase family DNA binding protein